jgi:hypothetical protein
VCGDIIFGGIVILFSKKGDQAGIDRPSAGRFIAYTMLYLNPEQPLPDLKNRRVPELINCPGTMENYNSYYIK